MKYLLTLTLLLSSCFTPVHAEFNGERWLSEIYWRMGSGCPDYVEDVSLSFLDRYAPTGYQFFGDLPIPPTMENDGQTLIFCSPEVPPMQSQVLEPDVIMREERTVAGMARWYIYTPTQRILECDIWLRTSTLNEMTVEKFVGHEWTHCFGLQHDPDPRALMYYAPTADDLHAFDKAELARLYNTCEVETDKWGNIFIPRADFTDWLLVQSPIIQESLSEYVGVPASFVQIKGEAYFDQAIRINVSQCE